MTRTQLGLNFLVNIAIILVYAAPVRAADPLYPDPVPGYWESTATSLRLKKKSSTTGQCITEKLVADGRVAAAKSCEPKATCAVFTNKVTFPKSGSVTIESECLDGSGTRKSAFDLDPSGRSVRYTITSKMKMDNGLFDESVYESLRVRDCKFDEASQRVPRTDPTVVHQ